MAKGSDLRNKLGTGGSSNLPKKADNTFHISDAVKDALALEKLEKSESIAANRPDAGHSLHKGSDKTKGGGGGGAGRPKV